MSKQTLTPFSNILITGATGLIGGEILRKLALSNCGTISALVRGRDDESPTVRFHERMARSQKEGQSEFDCDQIDVVGGDITAANFGLGKRDANRLRDSIDVIIHCAADTSFIRQQQVRDTNIAGAKNLVEFAQSCRRRPLVVYMSTATNGGKLKNRCVTEDEGCQPDNEHHNEYTHSKAVAETMLRESGVPLLIVRPTIVLSADLPDPVFARAILWFVPLLNEFGAVPLDPLSRLDLVPVSSVVDSTLALLAKPDRKYDCYHLSAGADGCSHMSDLAEFINRFYSHRMPFKLMSPNQWNVEQYRTFVKTRMQRSIFFGLRYYLPFLNMNVVYDNARLREELAEATPPTPSFQQYMGKMLQLIPLESAVMELATP